MPFWESKPKAANGEPLDPMKGWQVLWRSVFEIDHAGHQYAIDTNLFDPDRTIHFYVDGHRVQSQDAPATFDVPDGTIRSNVGTYSLSRAHLILSSGEEHLMTPAPGTTEHWRLNLKRQHPTLSMWIDRSSWTILIISLLLTLLQIAEWALPNVGINFTSPVSLPTWMNALIIIAGFLAAIDRALQFKNHWLLDSDWL